MRFFELRYRILFPLLGVRDGPRSHGVYVHLNLFTKPNQLFHILYNISNEDPIHSYTSSEGWLYLKMKPEPRNIRILHKFKSKSKLKLEFSLESFESDKVQIYTDFIKHYRYS